MHEDSELVRRRSPRASAPRSGNPPTSRAQDVEVWDGDECRPEFEVLGVLAPFVHARQRAHGVERLLMFRHHARCSVAFEPTPARS